MTIHLYGVLELVLQSMMPHPNPDRDCTVMAEFTAPSGRNIPIQAFWDGGSTWKIRFSPDEVGQWTWRTTCIGESDEGLVRGESTFACTAYRGDNPLYLHGPLQLAASRRSMEHKDGTPFFWLADTAWNGVIRGDDNNWREFLSARAAQRFTAIQFVSSQWRGDALDEAGEPSFYEGDQMTINPAYFQRLDRRVAMINELGLVAAPVALWSLLPTDPGYKLNEEDSRRLASYIVSRYDAYQVVWLLGGDGDYRKIGVERWKRIGRAVFSVGHNRLVSLHPCGQNWIGDAFEGEDWYDIVGYQSGHGDSEAHIRWLVQGPPSRAWVSSPPRPIINMEPNYETAHGYQRGSLFTAFHVRRAAYWSLLVSPMAGVTYGHDAVWNWNLKEGPSEGHGNWHGRSVPPWRTGLDTPGVRSMSVMRGILDHVDWTTSQPCQDILAEQPGDRNVDAFIAAGRMADGTVLIYSPLGGPVRFKADASVKGPFRLVNPETGEAAKTLALVGDGLELPGDHDWLVVCGGGWK